MAKDFPASDSRYEAIFHNLPFIAFTMDPKVRVVEANDYTLKFFHTSIKEAFGKPFTNIAKLGKRDLLHAFSEIHKTLGGKVTGKSIYSVELINGEKKILELISIPLIKNGKTEFVLVVGEDVTQREEASAALRRSQNLLNSIIDQSPYATWISDEKGTLLRINPACRRVLNVEEEELVGKYNVLRDEAVEGAGFMPLVRDVFSKGKVAEFRMEYDSGKVRHVSLKHRVAKALDITIFPIKDAGGRVTNAVIQHNDITEEEKAKEEVMEKVDELEKFGKFSVGRELKMVELKNRIAELERKLAEKEGK